VQSDAIPVELVRDDHHRDVALEHLGDPLVGALLEREVAHREHLVDDEHVGVEVRGDGEAEAGVHAAGVPLDRRVDEVGHVGELHDPVELGGDLAPRHPHDRALQEDVLAPGQVRVETGRDLEQRTHATRHRAAPAGGPEDAGEELEHGALPRPVRPDDA
jgi:hypothetical protein